MVRLSGLTGWSQRGQQTRGPGRTVTLDKCRARVAPSVDTSRIEAAQRAHSLACHKLGGRGSRRSAVTELFTDSVRRLVASLHPRPAAALLRILHVDATERLSAPAPTVDAE